MSVFISKELTEEKTLKTRLTSVTFDDSSGAGQSDLEY